MISSTDRRANRGPLLRLASVAAVIAVGYAGFRYAARLDLGGEAGAGLAALAVVTGVAAFFSPCSFPLLVGLLVGSDTAAAGGRSRREGVTSAFAMGLGAAIFLVLTGAVVGLFGAGVAQNVNFSSPSGRILRGAVAVVIVGAGLVQLGVLQVSLARVTRLAQPIDRLRLAAATEHRRVAQGLYGFGFVLAGFG